MVGLQCTQFKSRHWVTGKGILNMLVRNLGVHEPEEERAQEVLKYVQGSTMIEAGHIGRLFLWFSKEVKWCHMISLHMPIFYLVGKILKKHQNREISSMLSLTTIQIYQKGEKLRSPLISIAGIIVFNLWLYCTQTFRVQNLTCFRGP